MKKVIWIVVFLFLSMPVSARAGMTVLSEEDILLARMEIHSLNRLGPAERAAHELGVIGVDPRVDRIIAQDYVCDDRCPAYGSLFLSYEDVEDAGSCESLGGDPKYSPGWHSYAGCRPLEVKIDVVLSWGERVEGRVYAGHPPDFFLRLAEAGSRKGDFLKRPARSIWTGDIRSIETAGGRKLERVMRELSIPAPLHTDATYQAGIYFKAASQETQPAPYNDEEVSILCRKAIALDQELSEAYYCLYDVYKKSEAANADKIAGLFERLVELDPDDAQAYYILGTAYAHKADVFEREGAYNKKAVRMLEKAVKLKPDYIRAHGLLATYYSNLLDINVLAARAQERYLELAELSAEIREAEEQQLQAFRNVAQNDPMAAGKALRWEGKFDEAIKEFKGFIDSHPKSPFDRAGTWLQLGLAYKDKGDTGRAIEAFEKTIETATPYFDRFIPPAYIQLGIIYRERGDGRRAKENFEKAVEAYRKIARENNSSLDDRIEKVLGMM